MRSLDFESSKSNHRRRNNRGLKFVKIWYFSERYRDYIFSLLDAGADIFSWHNRITWHYQGVLEVSSQSDIGIWKSTLSSVGFKQKKFIFRGQTTLESLKLILKIHICQDEDHPEISSPQDEESWETAIRLFTSALICSVKSDIMFVLEFYSTCAIFDLCQNTCYIKIKRSQ